MDVTGAYMDLSGRPNVESFKNFSRNSIYNLPGGVKNINGLTENAASLKSRNMEKTGDCDRLEISSKCLGMLSIEMPDEFSLGEIKHLSTPDNYSLRDSLSLEQKKELWVYHMFCDADNYESYLSSLHKATSGFGMMIVFMGKRAGEANENDIAHWIGTIGRRIDEGYAQGAFSEEEYDKLNKELAICSEQMTVRYEYFRALVLERRRWLEDMYVEGNPRQSRINEIESRKRGEYPTPMSIAEKMANDPSFYEKYKFNRDVIWNTVNEYRNTQISDLVAEVLASKTTEIEELNVNFTELSINFTRMNHYEHFANFTGHSRLTGPERLSYSTDAGQKP